MIYGIEEYERFIHDICSQIPVLKTEQLVKAIMKTYDGFTEMVAYEILFALQNNHRILLSEDGWAITKQLYKSITNDKFLDSLHLNNRYYIGQYVNKYGQNGSGKYTKGKDVKLESLLMNKYKRLINCAWLLIDMMPECERIVSFTNPWDLSFITTSEGNKQGKLYQLIYIPEKDESATLSLLNSMCNIDKPELRDSIRRIVILENENHAFKVQQIGVKFICSIDENEESKYKIIENRSEDMWKYYE